VVFSPERIALGLGQRSFSAWIEKNTQWVPLDWVKKILGRITSSQKYALRSWNLEGGITNLRHISKNNEIFTKKIC